MKDRIKKIRKELDLTQQKFANKLGVQRNTIAMYEMGKNAPSEAVILSICREFNVNEGWLRNGSGEMFLDFTEDEFLKAAASLSGDTFVRSLIVEYCKLDENSKKLFRNFIHKLSDGINEQESRVSIPSTAIGEKTPAAAAIGEKTPATAAIGERRTVEELEEEYKKTS